MQYVERVYLFLFPYIYGLYWQSPVIIMMYMHMMVHAPFLAPIYDYLERVLYNRLIYSLTYLERILSVLCSDLDNHFHEEWNWKLKVNASLCLVERQSESNFSVEGNDNSGQSWLFIYHFTLVPAMLLKCVCMHLISPLYFSYECMRKQYAKFILSTFSFS